MGNDLNIWTWEALPSTHCISKYVTSRGKQVILSISCIQGSLSLTSHGPRPSLPPSIFPHSPSSLSPPLSFPSVHNPSYIPPSHPPLSPLISWLNVCRCIVILNVSSPSTQLATLGLCGSVRFSFGNVVIIDQTSPISLRGNAEYRTLIKSYTSIIYMCVQFIACIQSNIGNLFSITGYLTSTNHK